MKLCNYGCGQEAKYQFKNGKWCCSKNFSSCPAIKEKISSKMKGRVVSEDTRKKMSDFQSGKIVSIETRKRISKSRLGRFTGKDNPNWKGGYFSDGIPLYDNFSGKLVEDIRRNKDDKNILEVKCSYNKCNKWFVPKLSDVYHRIESLNDIDGMGESNLYCSERCKKICSRFGLNHDPFEMKENNLIYTDHEYKTFRKFVLERDNYKCQYCGKQAKHIHHERPQKLEPFFALDPDLAWSVCRKCHYEKGHKKGTQCSTGNLKQLT